MAKRRRRTHRTEEDEEDGGVLKGWIRDAVLAVIVVAVVFGGIFAYTQVWPPLVVVESQSMQHSDDVSFVGAIDTGDLVLVQAAPARGDVVTWVQGRVTGYSTYGDYGDVIIFHKPGLYGGTTPVIHRAILYLVPDVNGTYDVPDLDPNRSPAFPGSEWEGTYANGTPATRPYGLRSLTIHKMGWRHDLGITFDLAALSRIPATAGRAGYVTMGDNNAYHSCHLRADPCEPFVPYDQGWIVPQENLVGHARGELPWFGLIKLTLAPTTTCCSGWGDPAVPKNSWDSLALSLLGLIALPFAIEGVAWAWKNELGPRLQRWRRKRAEADNEPDADAPEDDEDDPTSGSSGP